MAASECVVERSGEACLLQNCLCTLFTVAAVVRAQFSSCTIIYSVGRSKPEHVSVLIDAFVLLLCKPVMHNYMYIELAPAFEMLSINKISEP